MNAKRILSAVALLAGISSVATAQTQTVSFQVDAINQFAITGTPSLVINTATAGSAPTNATANVTWAVTTNQTNTKVSASIGSAMPAGLTLTVNLTAPSASGTSAGAVTLGTGALDLVTGITKLAESGLGVVYTLSATPAAGVVASTNRVVTYTITGGT